MSKESAMALAGAPSVPRGTPPPPQVNPDPLKSPVPPVEGTTTEPEATAPLDSSRFANLAKKEAKVVAEREAIKAEKAKLDEEKKQLQTVQKQIQDFEALRKADPVAALKSIGFSETDIFNFLSANEKKELTPEEQAKKVAQDVLEDFKKSEAEKASQAQAAKDAEVISKFKGDIKTQLEANKEKFWRTARQGEVAEFIIFNTIQEDLKNREPGDIKPLMTIEEATQMLEDQYKWEHEQMLSEEKKRSPLAQAAVDQAVENAKIEEVEKKANPQPKPKTIPAAATATVASTTVKRKETKSEKRERLINQLRNGG